MSGTSMDAIDCALIDIHTAGTDLVATHCEPIPEITRRAIADISLAGANEIERMGVLDRSIGSLFASATNQLLATANINPTEVIAIGSHGQTIRHRPPSDEAHAGPPFTLQIGDPSTIAELTGITTVADFRRRDIAAGGEGAPLAPAFHAVAFSTPDKNRAVVNIGGIANITILKGPLLIEGFDSGPGNTLLDLWTAEHKGEPFDRDGGWASQGTVSTPLLTQLLSHSYFQKTGPRSTGKEAFNRQWLEEQMASLGRAKPVDIQATLLELTARSITTAIASHDLEFDEVLVCGGGAHNQQLMNRLEAGLPDINVTSTETAGMDPDWVEAATFAWLASRTLEGLTGNEPVVTGAQGPRILGAIYPA